MNYTMKCINVDDAGVIHPTEYDITSNISRLSNADERLGDESTIQHGDLVLEYNADDPPEINRIVGFELYYLLYIDDILFNAYVYTSNQDYNEKTGKFRIRLKSCAIKFFDDLKERTMFYTTVSTNWCYEIGIRPGEINTITLKDGSGSNQTANNRYCYALADIIESIRGKPGNDYIVGTVTHPITAAESANTPVLFKGLSADIGLSEEAGFDANLDGLLWADVFKIALYAYNCFLSVTPRINGGLFNLDIELVSRTKKSGSGALSESVIKWKERTVKYAKFKLDKFSISGTNFTYNNGSGSDRTVSKDLDVADPDSNNDDYATDLYLIAGDWDGAAYDQDKVYFHADYIDTYYDAMTSSEGQNGYEGKMKMKYNDGSDKIVRLPLVVAAGSDAMYLSRIQFQEKDKNECTIEGIKTA